MNPPPDYEVNEISYEEAIQDIYDMVGEIDRKLNRMMLWCAGVAITLAVCMFKLFIS